jgi:hypothetical protein
MTLKAVLLTTPHEKSITLHRTIEEAEKAVHDFLIDIYATTQHSSYEGLPVKGLGLEDLLEYFDGEIEYEIFETSL